MKDIEFTYKDTLVDFKEISKTAESLNGYVEQISGILKNGDFPSEINYTEPESSINLPYDSGIYKKVEEVVEKVRTDKLKYIIVIGIGGSNLGTKAIYDAIYGGTDSFSEKRIPKILFADTVSSKLLKNINVVLDDNIKSTEEILINIISKSGTTVETIVNFEIVYSILNKRFSDIKNRIVVTTDQGSRLWNKAEEEGLELLSIPKVVGGRYSVFSAVGLFPLAVAGIDVKSLLNGAGRMSKICTENKIQENPAMISAVLLYIYNQKGIMIHNSFFFNQELESVGKWYRQLLAESIGKRHTTDGKEIHMGITPIVSIGSTSLHSMAQLYLDGPKDKFTTFVYSSYESEEKSVPEPPLFFDLIEEIKGKDVSEIMSAIFSSVKESYRKNKLPFTQISLPNLNEYALGQFLQLKMFEVMYLAHLLNVNAFDQPSVEDYKTETKKILSDSI